MKKLFEQLNAMIVEAIMQGSYDTVATCEYFVSITVEDLPFQLWIANTAELFKTYSAVGDNTMSLCFSDEQKKILFERFRTLFEQSDAGRKEREAYERLKSKYENKVA